MPSGMGHTKKWEFSMKKHPAKNKTNVANTQVIMTAENVSPLAKMLVSRGLIRKHHRVLSLGAGIGLDEEYFVSRAGAAVLGTEVEETLLRQARRRTGRRLKFIRGDVTRPFDFGVRFDCVYARNLLHYFPPAEQRAILGRIHAALVPEGLLVIQLKSRDDRFYTHPQVERVLLDDGMVYFPQLKYSRNHLSGEETERLLDLAGFETRNISTSMEVLYSDAHESTLITAIAGKKSAAGHGGS